GLRWPVAPFVVPRAIKRVWDGHPFDLLRAHSLRYIGPAALIARRRYRLDVPIVAHHHHLDPSWLNPLVEKRVMRAVDRVVVGSEFGRRQAVEQLGVPAERFSVVSYGVDRRFRPGPRPEALLRRHGVEGKVVVLFLGGLKRRKILFVLLDVWRRVAQARDDATLVVGGEGGFLCDPERPDTFVGRGLQLLSDPMLRKKFGRANRERVDRRFRWDHCAAATARIYAEVVDDWRRRRPQAR